MAYYLRHYFDPDFRHDDLTPQFTQDGAVTFFYLGYVQNVVAGQVVAELIDLNYHPELAGYDPRYIYPEPFFPCGPNCSPHPNKPTRMIASTNGYCFYHEDLITVKKLLNVRRDVNFHTGNIMFVGDIVAHEAVHSGFTLLGNNILVKGIVEDADIIATGNLVVESGIKGAGKGRLISKGNIKLSFCENMHIEASGNIEIDGSCMHCSVYAGGSLMVKGRLQGGNVYAKNIIYVRDQIGGGQDTVTKVTVGYSPDKIINLINVENEIHRLNTGLGQAATFLKKNPALLEALEQKIRLLQRKLKIYNGEYKRLKFELQREELQEGGHRLICPGKIRPSVDLNISGIKDLLDDFYQGMEFLAGDEEIIHRQLKN